MAPQILADGLTLSQPGEACYALPITTAPSSPRIFKPFPTALQQPKAWRLTDY